MACENLPQTVGVEYRIVEGYPDYAVGDDGSVWSKRMFPTWKKLKGCVKDHGYVAVSLYSGPRNQTKRSREDYVHRLVLETFIGPCPEGMEACHFPDRDTTNNKLKNLRWGTGQDNSNDAEIHGTRCKGIDQHAALLTDEIVANARARYDHFNVSMADLAEELNVDLITVFDFIKGRTWKHAGGPIWPDRIPQKKLTRQEAAVLLNRFAVCSDRHQVAAEFGVSESTVRDIAKGRTWKSISA